MANRATRCPHCQTSFRVTESQLATARGRVRCGACLEVFNATANWVDPAPSQPEIPEPEPRYDDNTPFPDEETEQEATFYSPPVDKEPRPATESSQPEIEAPRDAEEAEAEAAPVHKEADEIEGNKEEAGEHAANRYHFSALESDTDTEALEHFSSRSEESDDDGDYPAFSSADSPDDDLADASDTPDDSAPASDPDQTQTNHELTGSEPESTATDHGRPEPDRNGEAENDDFDALVAHQRRRIQISRQQVGWTLLCLLAGGILAGQIVYTNFSSLAQSQHRNALVETCKVINWAWGRQRCVLPPPRNLSRIDSLGLNIMSHPRYANSLLVDTIILNRARFEQPFPLIELIFRNDRGNIVARRAFAPNEYLAGELQGIKLMPVGQSVRINISIADPGSTAVNYEMQFLPVAES